jgi:hypothetical protein
MRTIISVILSVIVGCLLVSCDGKSPVAGGAGGDAAPQPAPSPNAQAAAGQGLTTFRALISKDNYKGMGFATVEDVQRATLGEPMKVFRIELDALKRYRAEANANDLLVDAQRSLYPVQVDQNVVTSLYVNEHKDGWRATVFGNSAVARALAQHRQGKDDFVVHVPALKVYFIGRRNDAGLALIALIDDPRFSFKAGEPMPSDRVLAVLQKEAEAYNGLPQ